MESMGTPFTPGSGVLWLPRVGITRSHPTVQGLLPQSPKILAGILIIWRKTFLVWSVRSKINFLAVSAKGTQGIEFPEVPLEWLTDDVCWSQRIKEKPCSELTRCPWLGRTCSSVLCLSWWLCWNQGTWAVSARAEKRFLGLGLWFSCKIPYALLRSESFQLL